MSKCYFVDKDNQELSLELELVSFSDGQLSFLNKVKNPNNTYQKFLAILKSQNGKIIIPRIYKNSNNNYLDNFDRKGRMLKMERIKYTFFNEDWDNSQINKIILDNQFIFDNYEVIKKTFNDNYQKQIDKITQENIKEIEALINQNLQAAATIQAKTPLAEAYANLKNNQEKMIFFEKNHYQLSYEGRQPYRVSRNWFNKSKTILTKDRKMKFLDKVYYFPHEKNNQESLIFYNHYPYQDLIKISEKINPIATEGFVLLTNNGYLAQNGQATRNINEARIFTSLKPLEAYKPHFKDGVIFKVKLQITDLSLEFGQLSPVAPAQTILSFYQNNQIDQALSKPDQKIKQKL